MARRPIYYDCINLQECEVWWLSQYDNFIAKLQKEIKLKGIPLPCPVEQIPARELIEMLSRGPYRRTWMYRRPYRHYRKELRW
jgi:hypothetical protein